jgi:hypothetical protein
VNTRRTYWIAFRLRPVDGQWLLDALVAITLPSTANFSVNLPLRILAGLKLCFGAGPP